MKSFKLVLVVSLLSLLSSCTHLRSDTNYMPMNGGYGKSVIQLETEGKLGAIFLGNAATSSKQAYHFSRLAAVEHCRNENEKSFAVLYATSNYSEKTSYTKVSSSSYTVPGYSRFNGKTYRDHSKDQTRVSTTSYPVTLKYPRFATIFDCATHFRLFKNYPQFETLSRELVSPFTQDFKGGLMVKEAVGKGGLQKGDVLVAIDGVRVENAFDLFRVGYLKPFTKKPVRLKVIRNKKVIRIKSAFIDATGIMLTSNQLEVDKGCEFIDYDRRMARSVYKHPPICEPFYKTLQEINEALSGSD